MKVQATEIVYAMLPTDDFLKFKISGVKEQPNYFDKTKQVLNLEFQITEPGYDKRKVWKNFGPFWPKAGASKTTQFFDLVKAVDPSQAIMGKTYDTDRLMDREGRLMMEDYETKEIVPLEVPVLDESGEETGEMKQNPDPRRGLPVIKQKVKLVVGIKGGATATAEPTLEESSKELATAQTGKKIKF